MRRSNTEDTDAGNGRKAVTIRTTCTEMDWRHSDVLNGFITTLRSKDQTAMTHSEHTQ